MWGPQPVLRCLVCCLKRELKQWRGFPRISCRVCWLRGSHAVSFKGNRIRGSCWRPRWGVQHEPEQTQISPLRSFGAPVEMTKGRGALPARVVAGQKPSDLQGASQQKIRVAHRFSAQVRFGEPRAPLWICEARNSLRGRPAVSLSCEASPVDPGGARAWPGSQIHGPEPGRDPTSPPWQLDRKKAGSCNWEAYRGW
jgi:hypothetical protein